MKVIVVGANGQVGRELRRAAWPANSRVSFLSHQELDIADTAAVRDKVVAPINIVINAAAYTAVDRAESERQVAYRANALGPGVLAERCAILGITLIHISTDYIFDGAKVVPYLEDDKPSPLNVYGESKLAGESAVRTAGGVHMIVRTASVFSEYGQNFVKTMLRLGAERASLAVVADQVSCPTPAADIAALLVLLAQQATTVAKDKVCGTYHFCGQPPVTWFNLARNIFDVASKYGLKRPELRPISAADYPSAARRPLYSALGCAKIAGAFNSTQPTWAARLPDIISAVLDRSSI